MDWLFDSLSFDIYRLKVFKLSYLSPEQHPTLAALHMITWKPDWARKEIIAEEWYTITGILLS